MTKIRLLIFGLTILVISIAGYLVILAARGYRIDFKTFKLTPSGILVIKSEPTGAQIFINANFRGATDTNLSLSPGAYDVSVKKDGFLTWNKRLTIEKEVVTQADLSLFKATPALSPLTFTGIAPPVASNDFAKLAFAVLPETGVETDKIGLWIMETASLPLGFNRDPKRITDGDLTGAVWQFSPSNREILLETSSGVFLLEANSFTSQAQRVNIASQKTALLASWKKEQNNKSEAQMRNLPAEMQDILKRKSSSFAFSPDETKVLYTASASGILADNLIPPLPGSSTQTQERTINLDHTYVYDIKEDRNFLINEAFQPEQKIFWLLNSKNLVLAEKDKITILDYDATNRQIVYSGSYVAPFAFPFLNSSKLLILTSLGSLSSPNLYSLNLK